MDRNRLNGTLGDRINALLSAAGMNFAKLVKAVALFLRQILGFCLVADDIGYSFNARLLDQEPTICCALYKI